MVWSSAQPHNVRKMVKKAFGPLQAHLVDVWDRTRFNLSAYEYNRASLTIKDLEYVWSAKMEPISTQCIDNIDGDGNRQFLKQNFVWNQRNTVLLDDSPVKAQYQPYNAIHLPSYDKELHTSGKDEHLRNVVAYFERVRRQKNVSSFIRCHPYTQQESWGEVSSESIPGWVEGND
ncbi:uncharacterized protein VTP21DRAFT_5906 [Calcarisporiella thermophila]|uniref:uncharacterized protein n=1 Tax=Calcarisporiella thermophila TaxID=911321 RepID=UPI00374414BB